MAGAGGGVAGGEVEELHLGGDHEREALLAGPVEVALEDLSWIALERGAVVVQDVAEHPGRDVGAVPGEQLEGVGIGLGQDVALLHPAEAVDGRAVEVHALFEGVLELGGEMATDLSWPSTSVNQRRISRTPRSSTVRST